MTRTFAADDAVTIGRRIAELRAERAYRCTCEATGVIGEDGLEIRVVNLSCPVHCPGAMTAMDRDVTWWRRLEPVRPPLDEGRLAELRELLIRHGIQVRRSTDISSG